MYYLAAAVILCIFTLYFAKAINYVNRCAFALVTARPLEVASTQKRPQGDTLVFYVFGDWGIGPDHQRAVAELLKQDLASLERGHQKAYPPFVVGTGDNIYPDGLSGQWTPSQKPDASVRVLQEVFGNVYGGVKYGGKGLVFHFVPGNHDHRGDVFLQETLAEGLFDGRFPDQPVWKYYPMLHEGVADSNDLEEYRAIKQSGPALLYLPELIPAGDPKMLTLAAIDTQKIIRMYEKEEEESIKKQWETLASIFRQNHGRWRMITGHHPLASHAQHGEPYSQYKRWQKLLDGWSTQHQENPAYRRFSYDFRTFIKEYGIHFYLAGHDHTLQLLDIDGNAFQIVSGAAAESRPVFSCEDTILAEEKLGLVRVDLSQDEVWLEYLMIDSIEGGQGSMLYRVRRDVFPEQARR